MKYITKEELQKGIWIGRGGSSKVFREIANMQVGQILFIEPGDWDKKYSPTAKARYIERKYKWKFNVLRKPGKQGWAIERVQ